MDSNPFHQKDIKKSLHPSVVIIISADIEWQALQTINLPGLKNISPFGEWFTHTIPLAGLGKEIPSIFFHGGWGKIAAAASTQYVIDQWHPQLLINLGTCGGFEGYVRRGEILLVERTIVYDIIEQMGDFDAHIEHYATNLDLSWLDNHYPIEVQRTLLVSGDRDLVVEEIPRLQARYDAIAGDWESGAIAFVAARNQVRLLILRGVTDLVGASGGEAYGNIQFFTQATQGILKHLVTSLPHWLERMPWLQAL